MVILLTFFYYLKANSLMDIITFINIKIDGILGFGYKCRAEYIIHKWSVVIKAE